MLKQGKLLLVACFLTVIAGAGVNFIQSTQEKEELNKGEEAMTTNVHIDPEIDLNSNKEITIIIHFKTKPARAAVELAKMKGVPLTLEQAEQEVKESHQRFQADVKKYLDGEHITYSITHSYTAAINGVAMRLPASAIQALLQSAEIEAIYANKEIKLIPPVKPS
ncbi:protease inhibitor I9 family protein [Neobacillus sp. WH10]|uniref:protease inhibitor I9 family protein n=1 Tax=Neobacillus sp. WH10 TaxID=3047873 RepID=UPI0024C17C0B|nr:protease inhibitor I9 family protein [Neobacillus sp. WH10]WHY77001.1 protease inhibitor I9 family protein [Neobacillus sp. WH10]